MSALPWVIEQLRDSSVEGDGPVTALAAAMDDEPLVAQVIGHQLLCADSTLVRTRAIRVAQLRPQAFGSGLLEALIDHALYKGVPAAYEIPEGDLGTAAFHAFAMSVQPGDERGLQMLRLHLSLPRGLWAVPALCRLDPLWMLSTAPSWFDDSGNRIALALDWLESEDDRRTLIEIARGKIGKRVLAKALLRSNLGRAEKAQLLSLLDPS
jgi:hypothetical protein